MRANTVKDMAPLYDRQVAENKVTCMDISSNMMYLIAGYKDGSLALWDVLGAKLEKLMPKIHTSEITGAKIYSVSEDNKTIQVVSSEVRGRVCLVEVNYRAFFMGSTFNKVVLFEKRLKTSTSIAVNRSAKAFEQGHWDQRRLVAFGSVDEVVVASMKPIKELYKLKRPNISKP